MAAVALVAAAAVAVTLEEEAVPAEAVTQAAAEAEAAVTEAVAEAEEAEVTEVAEVLPADKKNKVAWRPPYLMI